MSLYLAIPARKHRRAWKEFLRTFGQDGARGFATYGDAKTYGKFLRMHRNYVLGRRIPKHHVPGSKFFLMEEGGAKILGVIDIRHRLNDSLLNRGGHIGYAVAPDARGKGYATEMLRLALEACRGLGIRRALITCNKENAASARVIQKSGGVLEDERTDLEGVIFQRYWIEL